VLKIRKDEPQSHRDLGLVISKTGDYELAIIHLWDVVTGKWDSRYSEIELTALVELNRLLWKAKDENKQITLPDHLDAKFIHDMSMDIRISMAWDTDMTDIDLHVIEPAGEECYYGKKTTTYGGQLSRDFTQGYGPEEYMCRRAPHGKYKIRAKYFASHQQSLAGGTTILLSIFTNYSRKDEQSQMITIRLQTNADIVDVGEIEFTPTWIDPKAQARIAELEKAIQSINEQMQQMKEEQQKIKGCGRKK